MRMAEDSLRGYDALSIEQRSAVDKTSRGTYFGSLVGRYTASFGICGWLKIVNS